ncbi:MAG: FAD:protein FMN transferase [Oscillospiraceae bacterium]|nr:FAD:protein FMN transferase [Oscillospiraceae bacterium]
MMRRCGFDVAANARRAGAALLITLLLLGAGGCEDKNAAKPVSETRLLLDTFCSITIYAPQDEELLSDAFGLCEELEALFSISAEGSDVWNINHAHGEPVAVSPQTAELIRAGVEYGEMSGGMFDISIGRLSTLWDFTGMSGVPAEADIAAARETVDYRKINIAGNVVQMGNADAWIDLGGIAKGYIADCIAEMLRGRGATSAIIDLGGNIVTIGKKADGSLWKIGVTDPFGERTDLIGIIETGEASVVSAGTYERRFVVDGTAYHHILDPGTGMPVRSGVAGVTIVSESSMDGDALSTTLLLLGSGDAAAVVERAAGIEGAVLVTDGGEIHRFGDLVFTAIGG